MKDRKFFKLSPIRKNMFKKKCHKCERKISKDYDFCPYCGTSFFDPEKYEKDYGMLGKTDLDEVFKQAKLPFGVNFIAKRLFKELNKQFKELDKEKMADEKIPLKGTSISISISSGGKPLMKINDFGKENKEIKKVELPKASVETARKYSKLPKEEAETKVRRMSHKVVYEILLPGVKNVKDVIINRLENSIEVKAFSKNKSYFKNLPVNLDVLDYKLEDGKLILELDE